MLLNYNLAVVFRLMNILLNNILKFIEIRSKTFWNKIHNNNMFKISSFTMTNFGKLLFTIFNIFPQMRE